MRAFQKFSLIFFVALFALVITMPLFGGDTYNYPVKIQEGYDYVQYYGDVNMDSTGLSVGDTTGNHYTKAFKIADCNDQDGFLTIVAENSASGTEDCNVYIQYSNDLSNWVTGTTDADLDAVGTTAVADTIGISAGADEKYFHGYIYARLKLDGQAGNPETTYSWSATFEKDDFPHSYGRVIDVGFVTNKK